MKGKAYMQEGKTEKECTRCEVVRPLEEFYKRGGGKWGYRSHCKACMSELNKMRSSTDESREAARRRSAKARRTESGREYSRMKALEYRNRHPRRAKANDTVNTLIKNGTIERRDCGICGEPDAVAHHPDYDAPLNIIWLCRSHHKQAHAALKRMEIEP
jgi:hypothetical protein